MLYGIEGKQSQYFSFIVFRKPLSKLIQFIPCQNLKDNKGDGG